MFFGLGLSGWFQSGFAGLVFFEWFTLAIVFGSVFVSPQMVFVVVFRVYWQFKSPEGRKGYKRIIKLSNKPSINSSHRCKPRKAQ